jgi:hypothetical protein
MALKAIGIQPPEDDTQFWIGRARWARAHGQSQAA